MRNAIILGVGTTAGAALLGFERWREREFRRRVRRLHRTMNGQAQAATQRLRTEWLDKVHVLALDVDQTHTYDLHPPLEEGREGWADGAFLGCPLPGADMLGEILRGEHREDFEETNPEAALALASVPDASGGMPPSGSLALRANRIHLLRRLRGLFESVLTSRRTHADADADGLQVVVVAGAFGGFGNGAHGLVQRAVLALAEEMHLPVHLLTLMLVPGRIQSSKDPENTAAVTHGVMKEFAAATTKAHWHRARRPGSRIAERLPMPFVPATMFVSDTNSTSARVLPGATFHGMVAELLRALVTSELGLQLTSKFGDAQAAAEAPTEHGEPRFGQSLGISVIHLDRERICRHAIAALKERLLDRTLQPVAEETIEGDVETFFRARHIAEAGESVHALSDHLLAPGAGPLGLVDPARFRAAFARNTGDLRGPALLEHARARRETSIQQSGDLEAALAARRHALAEAVEGDLAAHTTALAQHPDKGYEPARQWLTQAIAVTAHLGEEAARGTVEYDARVAECARRIDHFENVVKPEIARWGTFSRWWRRRFIEESATRYRQLLEEHHIWVMRCRAHQEAVAALGDLAEPLKRRALAIQAAVEKLGAERDHARAERARVATHMPDFECPVGLSLVAGAADLDAYYARLLPGGGEAAALREVHGRLLAVEDPVDMAADPKRLREGLDGVIEPLFRRGVDALHVGDEFLRRFPDPVERARVLDERHREAFERLPLKDSAGYATEYVVCFAGLDPARSGDTVELLNRSPYARQVRYQAVPTDDAERITLMHYRAAFPVSNYAHFARFQQIYARRAEGLTFERHHVLPGARSLPEPGTLLSECEVSAVAVRAWVLGRLAYDLAANWALRRADDAHAPLPLGADFDELAGPAGYGRAVDVVSDYFTRYQADGPDPLAQRLAHLGQVRAGKAVPTDDAERLLALRFDDNVRLLLERELGWWSRNTLLTATAWAAPAGRGRGRNRARAGNP